MFDSEEGAQAQTSLCSADTASFITAPLRPYSRRRAKTSLCRAESASFRSARHSSGLESLANLPRDDPKGHLIASQKLKMLVPSDARIRHAWDKNTQTFGKGKSKVGVLQRRSWTAVGRLRVRAFLQHSNRPVIAPTRPPAETQQGQRWSGRTPSLTRARLRTITVSLSQDTRHLTHPGTEKTERGPHPRAAIQWVAASILRFSPQRKSERL